MKTIQRRFDIDWLRVLAILAIFVFHCTRLFDTDDWHIKNYTTYMTVTIWKEFAISWGMPLILIISGVSAFYALGKVSAGKYIAGICTRLLLPLVVGMFTHVAFQVYLGNLKKGAFNGSFLEFYPLYFDGMYGFGGNFSTRSWPRSVAPSAPRRPAEVPDGGRPRLDVESTGLL